MEFLSRAEERRANYLKRGGDMPEEYRWSKCWAVQCEHDSVQVGQVITVYSQQGPKKVRVTDVVVRKTKTDKAFDLLFTVDVD